MSDHDTIDTILRLGISIIQDQVNKLQNLSDDVLAAPEANKLINYLSCLVSIRKDWRLADKEAQVDTKTLTNEELEAAILLEAEKIKNK